VLALREDQGCAVVKLAAPLHIQPGHPVLVEIDIDHRLDYACQHTAEHLIAALMWRRFGIRSVSVHFGPDRSLVDFDAASIEQSDLDTIEDEANRIIAGNFPVRVHLCPPEDLSSFALRRPSPPDEDIVRVVEIEGIDCTPCCGVHLESTGDLRIIRIVGAERYKRMTRVYYIAGGRAVSNYRMVSRIAREASRLLGTSESSLFQAVEREVARREAAEERLVALRLREDERDAESILEELSALCDTNKLRTSIARAVAVRCYTDRHAGSIMDTAKVFASKGLTALIASIPDLTVQAVAPRNGPDLGARLTPILAESGGRGGGGRSAFRAVFQTEAALNSFLEAAEKLLRNLG